MQKPKLKDIFFHKTLLFKGKDYVSVIYIYITLTYL